MKFLSESYQKNGSLHHAYLLIGDREGIFSELAAFIESDLGLAIHGNPDFWHGSHDSLSIEEGRALKEMQEMRSLAGGKKIFVVSANTITEPAQNSLLKVFEEPTPDTHFFLIMPSAEGLLPTFRSRVLLVQQEKNADESPLRAIAKEFLAAKPGGRMALAKDFADDISDEKRTRTDAFALVSNIEELLYEKTRGKKLNAEQVGHFAELLKVKDYLGDRSASVKMLLEHLALFLP